MDDHATARVWTRRALFAVTLMLGLSNLGFWVNQVWGHEPTLAFQLRMAPPWTLRAGIWPPVSSETRLYQYQYDHSAPQPPPQARGSWGGMWYINTRTQKMTTVLMAPLPGWPIGALLITAFLAQVALTIAVSYRSLRRMPRSTHMRPGHMAAPLLLQPRPAISVESVAPTPD
jgi:hypothetical protein